MATNTFNFGQGQKAKKIDVEKKRESLINYVSKRYNLRISRLKNGLEKVKSYAEQVKEEKINSVAVDYEYEKSKIEKDLSVNEQAIKEASQKIADAISKIGADEKEGKIIKEAIEKTNYINELASKQKEAEKQKKLKELEERYNEAVAKAEKEYNSFISKYTTIFKERINQIEKDSQTKLNIIRSADERIVNDMFDKLTGRKTFDSNNKFKALVSKYKKYKDWVLLTVLAGSFSLAIYNDRFDSIKIKSQQKKETTIKISVLPSSTENQLVVPSTSSIVHSPINQVIKSTSAVENKNQIKKNQVIKSTAKINKNNEKVETKVKTKEKKQDKPKQEAKKHSAVVKSDLDAKLEKMIVILKDKKSKLMYDGIPLLQSSTKNKLNKLLKEVDAKLKSNELLNEQKEELLRFFRSVDKYIKNEDKFQMYTDLRNAIEEIRDGKYSTNSIIRANKIMGKALEKINDSER
jgi:hypothetical protein